MAEHRKLATILAIDVAGYSRAAEADDAAAADSVRRLRAAIEALARPRDGRIFSSAGDGFMLEFPTASSGLSTAVALLEKCENENLPPVRMGLHLGEVIVEPSGDLLGHGVNIAARLQQLTAPGGLAVSEDVKRSVRGAGASSLKHAGAITLNKMDETLEVYVPINSPGLRRGTSKAIAPKPQILAAAALAATVIAVVVWGAAAWSPAEYAIDRIDRIARSAASEAQPALSNDGRFLIYARAHDSDFDLFLQNTSGGEPIQLTDTPDRAEYSTAWSPQGDQIAFSTREPFNSGRTCSIFTRIVPDGGEREVGRCVGANYTGRLSWSPTQDRLLFADNSGPDANSTRSAIRELDLTTGEVTTIVPPQTGADDFNPSYSPDGRRILFVRHTAWASAQVMVYDVRSRRLRPVTNDRTSVAYAAWAPDGRSALISSNRSGVFDLWQFPLNGAPPRRLGAPYAIRPALGGDFVTFEINRFSINIMLLQSGRETPLTTGDQFHYWPNFAPDGSLAFTSIEEDSWIYVSRAGEPPRRSIQVDALFPRSLRWSSDSRRIAFIANTNYVAHIFIADVSSGRVGEIPGQDIEPLSLSWGVDGESLLVAAREEQGVRVWRIADEAGAPAEAITDFGWTDAIETEDGLFAANLHVDQRGGPGVYRLHGDGSAVRLTQEVDNASQLIGWEVARGRLYYLLQRQAQEPAALLSRSLAGPNPGPASLVARLAPGVEGLAVHPSREIFALPRVTSENEDIGLARLRRE